ncbi:MAG TPA: alkane 1-monooxygenase [Candidatus Cybelea sp.]|nr:alkane 1-monooxygenase [Candidatus Cybelea sp.]
MQFYVAPFLALLYVAFASTSGTLALYATLPFLAASFAVLDAAFGLAPPTAPHDERRRHVRPLPWLYIPLQVAVTLLAAIAASRPDADAATIVGLALAVGTVAGIFGMLAAHEMIHSPRRTERALGLIMLASTTYMHFRISHIRSHHRLAATADDPATARRGESAYRFICRSVTGQFRAALSDERARVERRNRLPTANRVNCYMAISAAIYLALGIFLGAKADVFFALQSLVAVFVLELFNYVVHYGLQRRVLPDGRLEPLGAAHSWNAPQRFTNWALMNGGYHSHHHRQPTRPHSGLGRTAEAPELPLGYAGVMALALVPPLWRAVMHPRIDRQVSSQAA